MKLRRSILLITPYEVWGIVNQDDKRLGETRSHTQCHFTLFFNDN